MGGSDVTVIVGAQRLRRGTWYLVGCVSRIPARKTEKNTIANDNLALAA